MNIPAVKICARQMRQLNTWTEIKIPVPWGHIAGKWWGNQDKRPILGVHGWMDNCGTFDTLAPLLPETPGLLAIDLPGHGLSSPYPEGFSYHFIDGVSLYKRLQNFFNWKQVSFLGHSLGSLNAFIFASYFPDDVDFIIGLDGLKPFTVTPAIVRDLQSANILKCLKYDNYRGPPKTFTQAEIIDGLCNVRMNSSVRPETAQYILTRGITKCTENPGRFTLNIDPKLNDRNNVPCMLRDLNVEYAKHIRCAILNLRMKESPLYEEKSCLPEIVDILKKSAKVCETVEMDGKHHEHLNHPERVLPYIVPFIEKYGGEHRESDFKTQDIHHTNPIGV